MLDDPKNHEGLTEWLESNQTGASSKAIVAHLTGHGEKTGAYPSDSADFDRCENLLSKVPSLRRDFGSIMPSVNAYWAALVPQWSLIKLALDKGVMIRSIVGPIEKADPDHARLNEQTSIRTGGAVTFQGEGSNADAGGRAPSVNTKISPEMEEQFLAAVTLVWSEGKCSTSFIQRKLCIGYNAAARIVERMEALAIVSKADKVGKREVRSPDDLRAALNIRQEITDIAGEEATPILLKAIAEGLRTLPCELKEAARQEGQLNIPGTENPAEPKMKETEEDKAVRDNVYGIAAGELKQFIERYERLEAEKKDIADAQKEVMAEAKGRGYDTKVMRKVIALRKKSADEIAEEEAVLDMYKSALGMG